MCRRIARPNAGHRIQYAYGAFLWLAVTLLQYLFFFGVAVFAVMCAGNALGALAIYGLFNFLAFLMAWLSLTFYEPVLYGVKLNLETIAKGSPIMSFTISQYFDFSYDNMTGIANFIFHPEDWEYLWAAAAVGVALLGLSLVCYRRRDLETAADLINLFVAGGEHDFHGDFRTGPEKFTFCTDGFNEFFRSRSGDADIGFHFQKSGVIKLFADSTPQRRPFFQIRADFLQMNAIHDQRVCPVP